MTKNHLVLKENDFVYEGTPMMKCWRLNAHFKNEKVRQLRKEKC